MNGLTIACLYPPNGNPAPGPKFDYKLNWFRRSSPPTPPNCSPPANPSSSPATTTSCPPRSTSTSPPARSTTHSSAPRPASRSSNLVAQGWTDAIRHLHPDEKISYFLGLLPQRLRPQRRPAHRPLPPHPHNSPNASNQQA
ncbi:hypothetical protein ACQ86N_33845 [Puia sp. P3]|uniref:hypothetical protein n=1 Tax=Puia sp. P3 TaxID=3423952 RepID=UPI003D66C2C8